MLIPFAVLLSGIATTVSARRHASSSEKTFDCYPAGWVRAPDLYPGLSTPADARLYLNGTECNQIVKWEVGLRLKERAILKFAASNVTLPERPVWNESFIVRGADENSEDEPGLAPILEGGWHSTKGAEDPYHKLMEEYEKKRKDKNLWIIRAVERDVFDYKLELQLHDGSENTSTVNDFDFYAVRQFNVHVPLTNYPPQFGDGVISYSFGDDDVSEVEGMFEYYFSLTKADGDIIDVIAGQSGFLPGGHAQTASSDLQKEVTLARPDNLKPAGAPDHYDIGPWLPACDEGSDANFTVSLSIPNQGQLVSNTAYPVQVTIDKVGNGSEYPVYVKLELASCRNDTWAMGYARNGSQQAVADSCSSISEYGELTRFSLPNGRGLVRRQQPMDQICGPDPERHAEDESEEESFMMRRSMWRMAHGREKSGGKKLERDSWHLPLDLDLDVFLNATPTFQSTFFDLNNLIRVQLFTQFSCEEESAGSSITSVSDLTDDDAWAGEYRPRRPKARGYRRTHYGVIPVTVLPARLDTPGPITPYTSPEAESIVLSADAVYTGQYPLVNSTWQTEFANRDLTKYKWVSWERMPPCDHNRYCGSGGAHNTVSNAWARKSCPQYWADRREASENVGLPEMAPGGQQAFSA